MKIIDTDELFGEFLSDYVKNNPTETESSVAEKMPELYDEFAHKPCAALDGKTPEEYYLKADGKQLIDALLRHVALGVPVPDYLCSGIVENASETDIAELLDETDEQILSYAVNLLGEKGGVKAYPKYVKMLAERTVSEDILDGVTEQLSKNPDIVKEDLLTLIFQANDHDRLYFLEILSRCSSDDRIFAFIMEEFLKHPSSIQLYLSYVTRFQDPRSLDILYKVIEEPSLNYVDFKELQLAIEALGGKYDKKRDFSNDKYYKKLHDIK